MKKMPCTVFYCMTIVFSALLFLPHPGRADDNIIYRMKISDAIGPGVADFINQGIRKASDENALALIIELDTPGGLAESMRKIVKDILACKIPVIVYVSPGGARAASAGVMITMASDIAAMAPGTNIGAAHPVGMGGKEMGKTISEKMINDMTASARSIAEKRGRNVEWVENAVRKSISVTETEALKENIIDLIAEDMDDLIRQLNGREIKGKGVLKLDKGKVKVLSQGIRTKILKTVSDPNIAYILLMLGLAGLYFELSHPGAIFPGVIGGISIILAFFALQTLPINTAGILLILLSVILFIMEMKITSYGLLSIAGMISLLLGSLMLFENAPGVRLSYSVLIPVVGSISVFFAVLAALVYKSQTSQPRTGEAGLIHEIGEVKKALTPEGKVFIHGELWRAVSTDPVEEGRKVRVIRVSRLVLEVEPVEKG